MPVPFSLSSASFIQPVMLSFISFLKSSWTSSGFAESSSTSLGSVMYG